MMAAESQAKLGGQAIDRRLAWLPYAPTLAWNQEQCRHGKDWGSKMTPKADYAEMVKQAEAAVASVKDGDLKGIAFGKILDALLGPGTGGREQQREPSPKGGPGPTVGRKAPGAKPGRKKTGPKAYVEDLISDGFFSSPKTLTAVRAELGNRGHHVPMTSLSGPMITLCQERQLRRQKAKDGKKQIYTYSHW